MKKKYNYLLNMMVAVKNVILFYATEWAGLTSFEETNDEFNDKYVEITDTLAVQEEEIKGYTTEKNVKRKSMAKIVVAVAKKIKAFASTKGDSALFKKMNLSMMDFVKGKANESLLKAKTVIVAANVMTLAERTAYGITPAQLTSLADLVKNFEEVITIPRDKIVVRKTASGKLPQLFRDAEQILENKLDGLMYNFEGTDFFTDYRNARIIVNQIRHTVIKGNVTAPGGEDLRYVTVKLKGKDKFGVEKVVFEEITDKDGNFAKSQLNPELTFDVEFVLDNYEPATVTNIDLKHGEIDRLDIVMVPKA